MASVGIVDEQDISAFAVQQTYLFGQGNIARVHTGTGYIKRNVRWLFPSGLGALVDTPDFGLPPIDVVIQKHTRVPLFRPFLNREVEHKLESHHAGRCIQGIASAVGVLDSTTLMQPALCTECVEEDYRNIGYAVVKRLFLMPGILACPTHGRPLLTFCKNCSMMRRYFNDPDYMQPRLSCPCGKSLVEIRKLNDAGLKAATDIALMAQKILQGSGPSDISPERIRSSISQHFSFGYQQHGRSRLAMFDSAVQDGICKEVRNYLRITERTLMRMIWPRMKTVVNPIQNLAIIFAVFGSLENFSKTPAIENAAEEFQSMRTRPAGWRSSARLQQKAPTKATFLAYINSLPPEEVNALQEKSRAWLAALKLKRPGLTRKEFRERIGRSTPHLFLSWVDKEWLALQLLSRGKR